MTYQQLQFKGLPFRPDYKQVFYIEGTYDVHYNRFFMVEYRRVIEAFHRCALQFNYLPELFSTAGIEKKIRYYAPYLSEKIMDVRGIASNAMLKYLTNRNLTIEPSVIFLARNNIADNTTTFLQLPLSEVCKDNTDIIGSILKAIHEVTDEWCFARINQISQTSRVIIEPRNPQSLQPTTCPIYSDPVSKEKELLHKKIEDDECRLRKEQESECRTILREESAARPQKKIHRECYIDFEKEKQQKEVSTDPEEERSIINTEFILRELRENVQKLRLEGVSLMAIHEFIDKQEPLSRMLITEDYRLFLPDYNNMEIEMGALPKAIYFLFLRYPDGIIYKHMPDYYNELLGIYKQLRPNTDEARINLTITKVVNPLGNALNENIARIRKAFIEKFDEHLANNYIITGERGLQYNIPLDRDLITWEE